MDFSDPSAWLPLGTAAGILTVTAAGYWLYQIINLREPFLDVDKFKKIKLVERKSISHNTRWLRFALESKDQRLGLPTGQHMSFLMHDSEGKQIFRSYTPVSDDDLPGVVDFVIKVYPTGKMTPLLDKLQVGDTVQVKGPRGRLTYQRNMRTSLGMLAGGSGITPMYQVANAILRDPKDKTVISLIYANVTYDDILLKTELDNLARMHGDRFSVYYVLERPPEEWEGGVGFVTPNMIKSKFYGASPNNLILMCGPLPMNNAMKKHLTDLGHIERDLFTF